MADFRSQFPDLAPTTGTAASPVMAQTTAAAGDNPLLLAPTQERYVSCLLRLPSLFRRDFALSFVLCTLWLPSSSNPALDAEQVDTSAHTLTQLSGGRLHPMITSLTEKRQTEATVLAMRPFEIKTRLLGPPTNRGDLRLRC